MASRLETGKHEKIVTRYDYFASSGIIAEGIDIPSLLSENNLPASNLFQLTEKTKVSKRLSTAIIDKNPIVITVKNSEPHIEENSEGKRKWVSDIFSIKPVPKDWIIFDPPIPGDCIE